MRTCEPFITTNKGKEGVKVPYIVHSLRSRPFTKREILRETKCWKIFLVPALVPTVLSLGFFEFCFLVWQRPRYLVNMGFDLGDLIIW